MSPDPHCPQPVEKCYGSESSIRCVDPEALHPAEKCEEFKSSARFPDPLDLSSAEHSEISQGSKKNLSDATPADCGADSEPTVLVGSQEARLVATDGG